METREPRSVDAATADRPCVTVGQRRYRLVPGETYPPDPQVYPDTTLWNGVPEERRVVSPGARCYLLLRCGLAPGLHWVILVVAVFALAWITTAVDFNTLYTDLAPWENTETKGLVIGSEPTEPGSGENRLFQHTFQIDRGTEPPIVGTCYSTSRQILQLERPLERSVKSPDLYRLVGTKLSKRSIAFVVALVVFGTLFFLDGFLFVVHTFGLGLRMIPLLARGGKAKAIPVRVELPNAGLDQLPVRRVTYSYSVDGKLYQTTPKAVELTGSSGDGYDILFYDRKNPARYVLIDEVPARVRFVPNRGFDVRCASLFFPILLVAVFVWELVWLVRLYA